ncbi:MAG TPA: hypothetical protein ENI17_11385 [Pseudomonas xinjiangensis]|uniref:Uncharacterized protein n=1 Tax=Halopseudomonas xinjiangensis TaxID=487184 RepID=A0A7V1FST3_9GAMM|nr:hypothetical protein [Halopseudomonas xinjiangensis]HEC48215.1 hypothetical protein [Halopseudomonas xinjiangensis]
MSLTRFVKETLPPGSPGPGPGWPPTSSSLPPPPPSRQPVNNRPPNASAHNVLMVCIGDPPLLVVC